jgi:hypothetical protein
VLPTLPADNGSKFNYRRGGCGAWLITVAITSPIINLNMLQLREMEISNRSYQIARDGDSSWLMTVSRGLASALGRNVYPLRFSIVVVESREATVESTVVRFDERDRHAQSFRSVEIFHPRKKSLQVRPFIAAQIIPTGVRWRLCRRRGSSD